MTPYPSTKFEIQKYYQNEHRFNGVYLRDNLPKITDGVYKVNLDEHESIGTHWITLYVNDDKLTYFNSFGVEYLPKQMKKFIGNKNIIANICRIQAYDSILLGFHCGILFISC